MPQHWRKALIPVGRLDYQTEGLLLLTDDGEFAQRISHPRYGCHKTYEVKVKGTPDEAQLDRLRSGIVLEGRRTAPCRITWMKSTGSRDEEGGNTWFAVELSEGRTRQMREMFFRIGHPVQKLRRVAIGPLRDTELPVGRAARALGARARDPAQGDRQGGGEADEGADCATSGGRAASDRPVRPDAADGSSGPPTSGAANVRRAAARPDRPDRSDRPIADRPSAPPPRRVAARRPAGAQGPSGGRPGETARVRRARQVAAGRKPRTTRPR